MVEDLEGDQEQKQAQINMKMEELVQNKPKVPKTLSPIRKEKEKDGARLGSKSPKVQSQQNMLSSQQPVNPSQKSVAKSEGKKSKSGSSKKPASGKGNTEKSSHHRSKSPRVSSAKNSSAVKDPNKLSLG